MKVIAAGTPVESIVAVTFHARSSRNMKLRVRHELERRRARELDPDARRRLAEAARSQTSAIGTIHAFARSPCAARGGASIRSSRNCAARRLRVFAGVFAVGSKAARPRPLPPCPCPRASRPWPSAIAANRLDELRKAAWNLAEWRDFDQPWDKRPFTRDVYLDALIDKAEATLRIRPRSGHLPENFGPLRDFVLRVQRARQAGLVDSDRIESELLRLPTEMRWVKGRDAFRRVGRTEASIEAFRQPADADPAARLRDELWEVVGLYQQEKAAPASSTSWTFCSAPATCWHTTARADLQRLQRIFVDEFQDTDPLRPRSCPARRRDPAERDWRKAQPPRQTLRRGRPKQSIYRFRRATPASSIASSGPARRRVGTRGQQHPIHASHPELRQRRIREQHRELPR